jgi:hypothetical protein
MWRALPWLVAVGVLAGPGCGGDKGERSRADAGNDTDASEEEDAAENAGDDAGESPGDDADAAEKDADAGPMGDASSGVGNKARVRGRVTFADGTAVGQVEVNIGGKRIKSDSRGVFGADDLPEGELEVSVENVGTSRAQLKVDVRKDRVAQAELFVLPLKKTKISSADLASEISDATDGVKVRFAKGSLRVKSTQQLATGEAETRFGLVKQSKDLKAAPGRLKGTRAGADVELDCFGMIDVHLAQGDQELELMQEAELELPLGPNSFSDGQEVDAWSFDTSSGKWKAENRAVVDKSQGGNGVAKVKATHFSWWTIAQPVAEQTCLSGQLLASDAKPLPYLWVQAVGTSYWGSTWAQTDAEGRFCLNVRQGTTQSLSAFGVDASTYFEWKQDVTAGSSPAMCGGAAACTDLGSISGTSLFDVCSGNVASNQNRTLLLSSSNTTLDDMLVARLESLGHAVSLGVNYSLFDGKVDLTPYDAVYLQANASWSADMPVAGQRQLINWVNCGGGLVTTEWTTWKIGSGGFQLIDAIFPAARTAAYGSPAMETYTKVSSDATLNAGLPDSFSFTTTNYSGTESNLNPRPGATIYYDSMMLDSGLLGWEYNLGRVASFSTTVGANEVADPNFSRLIANTLDWAQRD